jgi:GH24 family phage-related lysozyme (muramidase)
MTIFLFQPQEVKTVIVTIQPSCPISTPLPSNTLQPTQTQASCPVIQEHARKTSQKGLELIAFFEGFRNAAYTCAADKCTVGFGHQLRNGPCQGNEWPSYVTREQGWKLLEADVSLVDYQIFMAGWELSQTKWDSLSSIIFNMGWPNFTKTRIYTALQDGDYSDVPWAIRVTTCCVDSLVSRREKEAILFESGVY